MSFPDKIKTLSLLSLLSISLLSGCQHLPAISPAAQPAASSAVVETHHFSVDYDQNLMGTLAAIKTQSTDTLPDIARHFGLGHNDIIAANPQIDPWLPEPDTRVLLPLLFTIPDAPRQGIVLNLANMRLFYFPSAQSEQVFTYPVGIGRDGWSTPLGLTRIISKTKNPTWNVPASIQREHAQKGDSLPSSIPAGPNNPLGEYAMRLARSRYLIHGTNKPYGVGMQMSHGCLNLYPEDIQELFSQTQIGTSVMIVDQPYLLARYHDMLFLEAHQPLRPNKNFKRALLSQIKQQAKKYKLSIDWTKVEQIITTANGIPTPILTHSPSLPELAANALLVNHPEHLYQQPVVDSLPANAWSVTAATLSDNRTARKLTAMLNHQGPAIPTRTVEQGNVFQVISGPFANSKAAKATLKRLEQEFDLDATINPPQNSASPALKKQRNSVVPIFETNFFENWFN